MPWRLSLARAASRIFPPLISNRLNLRHIYPFERAHRDAVAFRSRAVTGSEYYGHLGDVHAYMFAMHGYFDWRVIAVAGAVLREGDLAVEVGANVGTETIALADLVGPRGKVFAIEPMPSNLDALRALRERSGLEQVEVVAAAVSDTEGTVEFVLPEEAAHSGVGHLRGRETEDAGARISVRCLTLDSMLRHERAVRLITIDVEGFELHVLRGAREILARDRPLLILEACESHLRRAGGTLVELRDELMRQGYRLYQIGKLGLRDVDLDEQRQTNWVGLPEAMSGEAARIHRRLLTCGVMPCLPGLNPLTRHAATTGST